MSTLRFIRQNLRFLGFGFLLTFICSLGQTFFIGVYNTPIRETFGLSNGDFGAIYGIATLCSALTLSWAGRLIDRVDLRYYTLAAIMIMALAFSLLSFTSSVFFLGLALYLLRFSGQGMMPHISGTSMGRYFEAARGRAVSIAQLGISLGTMTLPALALYLLTQKSWLDSWAIFSGCLILIAIPIILWLLKGHGQRHEEWMAQITVAEARSGEHTPLKGATKSPLRSTLLRDKRFYMALPGMMSMPLFCTAIFFYPDQLTATKGWDSSVFALSFSLYAIASTISSLGCGMLVDRIGSLRLLPLCNIPFIIAMIVLASTANAAMLPAMMFLMGLSTGAAGLMSGTIWPEFYGTKILGTIRSFVTAIIVLSTAITPPILGYLYDHGLSINHAFLGFAAYMTISALIQVPLASRKNTKTEAA